MAQTSGSESQPVFFAQCKLDIEDRTTFINLEQEMRLNPYIKLVRLDWNTKRAFLLTKDISSFTEDQLLSWLSTQSATARCIQIGLHGTDQIASYPFANCEN